MKNFDEFFLSNLTDLKKEVENKNPSRFHNDQPQQNSSLKKTMTLADYKEQVKQQHSKPIQKSNPEPSTTLQSNTPPSFQNYAQPQTQQPQQFYYNNNYSGIGQQPPFYNQYAYGSQNTMMGSNVYFNNATNSFPPQFNQSFSQHKQINLNPSEENYYKKLYSFLPERQLSGDLPAKVVVDFIKTSNINKEKLKEFWRSLNKPSNKPDIHVTQNEFFLLLKMIALAQNNIEPIPQNLANADFQQLPVFHNVEEEDAFESFQVSVVAQNSARNQIRNEEDEFGDFEHSSPQLQRKRDDNDLIFLDSTRGNTDFPVVINSGDNYDKYNVFDEILDNKKQPISPEKEKDFVQHQTNYNQNPVLFMNNQQQGNNNNQDNAIPFQQQQQQPSTYFNYNNTINNDNNNSYDKYQNNPNSIANQKQIIPVQSELYNPFSPESLKKQASIGKIPMKDLDFELEPPKSKVEDEFLEFQESTNVVPENNNFMEKVPEMAIQNTSNVINFQSNEGNKENNKNEDFMEFQTFQAPVQNKEDFMDFEDFHIAQPDFKSQNFDFPLKNQQKIEEIAKTTSVERNNSPGIKVAKGNVFDIDWPEAEPEIQSKEQGKLKRGEDSNTKEDKEPEFIEFKEEKKEDLMDFGEFEQQPKKEDFNEFGEFEQSKNDEQKTGNELVSDEKMGGNVELKEEISARNNEFEWVEAEVEVQTEKPRLVTKKTEDLMDFNDEELEPQEQPITINTESNPKTQQTTGLDANVFDWKIAQNQNNIKELLEGTEKNENNNLAEDNILNMPNKDALEEQKGEEEEEFEWNEAPKQSNANVIQENNSNSNAPPQKNNPNDFEFEWNEPSKNPIPNDIVPEKEGTQKGEKTPQIASKYDLQELFPEPQSTNSGLNILDLLSQVENLIPTVKILNLSMFSGSSEEITDLAEALFSLEMYDECEKLMEHHRILLEIAACEAEKKRLIVEEKYEDLISIRDKAKNLEKSLLPQESVEELKEVYSQANGRTFSGLCLERLADLRYAEGFILEFRRFIERTVSFANDLTTLKEIKLQKTAFVELVTRIEGREALIRDVYHSLKQEITGIDAMQLRMVSENEEVQRMVAKDPKFQVYVSGLRKLCSMLRTYDEIFEFVDPDKRLYPWFERDAEPMVQKLNAFFEYLEGIGQKEAKKHAISALETTKIWARAYKNDFCRVCLTSMGELSSVEAKGKTGHACCLNFWLARVVKED